MRVNFLSVQILETPPTIFETPKVPQRGGSSNEYVIYTQPGKRLWTRSYESVQLVIVYNAQSIDQVNTS